MNRKLIKPICLFAQFLLLDILFLMKISYISLSFSSYVLISVFSVCIAFCFHFWTYLKKLKRPFQKKSITKYLNINIKNISLRFLFIFSSIMTFIVMLACYEIYTNPDISFSLNALNFVIALFVSFQIWMFICIFLQNLMLKNKRKYKKSNSHNKWFFMSWAIIGAIYLIHLIFIQFPGIINSDAFEQMDQIFASQYNGLYAFAHTQLIYLFLMLGSATFQNMYAATFLFCLFQVILLSATFAYVVRTIIQVSGSKIISTVAVILFALVPCHIFLSATMFTDIYFCMSVCVFSLTTFRIFKGVAKLNIPNTILFVVSALGMALFRSNGIYAVLVILVVFVIMFWKNFKNQESVWFGAFFRFMTCAVIAFLILGPGQTMLGVTQIDLVNKISIPGQQIAKVVVECDDLDDHDIDMVNNVLNIDELKSWFDKNNFDPLKFHIRANGNQEYISDNMGDFVNLYFRLGLAHPDKYVSAWIDSTSDYWSPHVDSLLFPDPNFAYLDQDYQRIVLSPELHDFFYGYMQFFDDCLTFFQSIGLYVWVFIACFAFSIYKRDRSMIFAFIPTLALLAVVIAATPIVNEIRYVYPVLCLAPFFVSVAFLPKNYFSKIEPK